MSQVDQHEAKPVLRHLITNPSKRILPLRWIISLGIFAFKTAVIAEHMGVHGPFFSREQRHSFARTLQVPAGVFMWYATLERQTHGAFKTRYVVPKLSSEKDFRLYVFTYTVGHFALQVVGSKWTANKPEGFGDFPFIEQNLSDSRVSTPFWPIPISHTPTTFIWPPPHYLAEESIDEFANRFGTLRFVS